MSLRYQAGINLPGYNPLKVANAPTIGAVTAGDSQVSVAFTAPACTGGGAITSYTAFANCGNKTASGGSSPLVVTGLTNCTAYTFKVIATNAYGPSYPSAASASATPILPVGQQAYTTVGTYSWVAPAGVTKVSVVAVGGGGFNDAYAGGGGGGGLGYTNNITVVPGNSYTVQVGRGGDGVGGVLHPAQDSYFCSTSVVKGGAGLANSCSGGAGGTYTGTGGGNGGQGGASYCCGQYGGGGGAGGYAGAGGRGASSGGAGSAGSGGGGGGGGGYSGRISGGGGGVGILGQGSNGAGGTSNGGGGGGGSGGCNGQNGYPTGCGNGGLYGGGSSKVGGNPGAGDGAVRIIWPGTTRSFPSTNTGNL